MPHLAYKLPVDGSVQYQGFSSKLGRGKCPSTAAMLIQGSMDVYMSFRAFVNFLKPYAKFKCICIAPTPGNASTTFIKT